MVAPRGQCVGDPLAGDALGSLQHVAVITAELDAGADSVYGDAKKAELVRSGNNSLFKIDRQKKTKTLILMSPCRMNHSESEEGNHYSDL